MKYFKRLLRRVVSSHLVYWAVCATPPTDQKTLIAFDMLINSMTNDAEADAIQYHKQMKSKA